MALTHPAFAEVSNGRRWAVSAVTGIITAGLAWLIAGLSFFIASQQQSNMLVQALDYFSTAMLLSALGFTLFNRMGVLRRPIISTYTGLAVSLVAAMIGTSMRVVGANPGIDMSEYVWGSIVSVNLLFILASTVLQGVFAPKLYARLVDWSPRAAKRKIALVRIPASTLAEGQLTHLKRKPVDLDLADEQWDNYCAALRAEGWDVREVAAATELPDSVFVEDMVVMFGSLAVLTSPGAPSREAELATVEEAVRALPGVRTAQIRKPGTLEGGDVLKVGKTVYVGASSRTNGEGIRQLRAIVEPEGYRVIAVPVERALHLKSAVTALPDGTIIGHPDLIDPALFDRFLAVPEKQGVAVVHVADDTLLISASAPKTAQLLANLGYRVIAVDVTEFEKLEGCVTCLSVRIR